MQKKIILLGMMSRHPVAGMVWLTMQHVIGLQRLGYGVYYVEAHGAKPKYFSTEEDDNGVLGAVDFLAKLMRRFDMSQQWAWHGYNGDANCYGMSECKLAELYRSADLILNLHGGTMPIPEYMPADRLVYLGTDPVGREIAAYNNDQEIIDLFASHRALFTWGENYGNPDCRVPVTERFHFFPTRQPIVLDLWQNGTGAGDTFTTIGSWKQWNVVKFQGEVYHWSKHFEFLKFIDLPGRTSQPFELALSGCQETDQAMLMRKGWRVRHAFDFTMDLDAYAHYICASRGEFTVAKDQNVRLRSGWFSDRSASYLAAGRPVITQETGFSNILPTGEGLFAFSTMEEILQAIEAINSDYERHSRTAREIAQNYFSYEVVLPKLLAEAGI